MHLLNAKFKHLNSNKNNAKIKINFEIMEPSESPISFNSTKHPSSASSISTSEFENFAFKGSGARSGQQLEDVELTTASSWGSSSKHSYYSVKRKYGDLMIKNNNALFRNNPEIINQNEISQINPYSEDSDSDQANVNI